MYNLTFISGTHVTIDRKYHEIIHTANKNRSVRNTTNAMYVKSHSLNSATLIFTDEYTLETSHMSVMFVNRHSLIIVL